MMLVYGQFWNSSKAEGPSRDDMEIVSVCTVHTWSRDECQQKRNYHMSHLKKMSDAVALYAPARAGNAKQFQQIAKASTSVTVKTGQAAKAVNEKSHNSIEAQIGHWPVHVAPIATRTTPKKIRTVLKSWKLLITTGMKVLINSTVHTLLC
jgi:hypothetical protein